MDVYIYTNVYGTIAIDSTGQTLAEKKFDSFDTKVMHSLSKGAIVDTEIAVMQKVDSKEKNAKFVFLNMKEPENLRNNARSAKFSNKEDMDLFEKAIALMSSKIDMNSIKQYNIDITKFNIKNNPINDTLIIQTVNNVEELEHSANTLSKRLREWYELYFPELSMKLKDHKKFAELCFSKPKEDLMKDFNIETSMGSDFSKEDLVPVQKLAEQVLALFKLKDEELDYLDTFMEGYCPNVKAICGTPIASKLLGRAGSLYRLAMFPSSTIQTLGAEKAMFRHLKTKARPPKFGYVLMNPMVASAGKHKGKAARIFANKISIAAKLDYFKGDTYKGYELKEEVEKEIKALKEAY